MGPNLGLWPPHLQTLFPRKVRLGLKDDGFEMMISKRWMR
jgi:hypothetical protein